MNSDSISAALGDIPMDEADLYELVGSQFRSLPRDELQKAQLDRTYIEGVLTETVDEICEKRRLLCACVGACVCV